MKVTEFLIAIKTSRALSAFAKKQWGKIGWEILGGESAFKCIYCAQMMSHFWETASFHIMDLLNGLLRPLTLREVILSDNEHLGRMHGVALHG